MVSPLGVQSLLTMQLGHELDYQFFRVCETVLSAITDLLWLGISSKTVYLAFDDTIFNASPKPTEDVGTNSTSDMENVQNEPTHNTEHAVVANAQEVKQ
ncbi:hypothetical protein FRC18_006171 [Serendipita sp. 400]|nr:hypothetical protein FRC18_006171 [Serendipita sp. 400]